MHSGFDIALFEATNQLVGRSFTLDALLAVAMDNPLVKGGPIAACFLFAWWHHSEDETISKRRATLLLTLVAAFLVAPIMKAVSTGGDLSPRPLVQAQMMMELDGASLREMPRVEYRLPATGLAAALAEDARDGTVAENELASFPSDHAALFAAFAAGIFLASRGAGLVAILWTFFVTLLPRVATGMHWPSDMLAGAVAGFIVLAGVIGLGRTAFSPLVDKLVDLASRYPGWSQALLFLLLAEVASAMETLQRLVELAAGILAQ